MAFADEAHRVESAGKIRPRQAETGLQHIQYLDDPAGFPGMGKLDFDAVEKRFLLQQGDQGPAINGQDMIVDGGSGAESNVPDMQKSHFETHWVIPCG
jgi:hypothetical protein